MKILFIAHHFQPEPNFFVGLPFAKALQERGHEVQVLTGFPNYPIGRIYDGYKMKFLQKEIIDNIPIFRVPLYPSHDNSSLKRIISYTSLSLSQAMAGPFVVDNADVAYVSQGPATIGLPSIIHKLFRGIPFVYNILDLWPDSLVSTGMFKNKAGIWLVDRWCKYVYKRSAKITVVSPGMKTKLLERGVQEHKVDVVYNWCDDSQITKGQPNHKLIQELGMAGKFNILFAGNIGKAQALDAVLDAAALLKDTHPDVQFVLMGDGVEVKPMQKKVEQMELKNVKFLARRPVSEVGSILCLADVLFVHLRKDPLFEITIPSKTEAYMAVGKPILIGVKGDAAELVKKAKSGLACEPENAESIAQVAKQFRAMSKSELDTLGANGKKFYNEQLSFDIGVSKYEKIFKSVINKCY